jgi:hypothetical protein
METPDKVSFASGVKLEDRQSYVSVNVGEMVEERVEMLSKISKNITIAKPADSENDHGDARRGE